MNSVIKVAILLKDEEEEESQASWEKGTRTLINQSNQSSLSITTW